MVDTATREVYAHALRSESRRPDAAESSGRPESLQLDRRPRRKRPRELSEVSEGLLLELTNRFISEFADPGKPARARVADTPNIYGREAARFLADGKVDQAIDTYRRALRLHPGDPRTLYNLGVLYEHRNDPVSASRYYEAALAADPDDKRIKDARARVFDRVRAGPRPLTDR
jgi:tetratricopeptide (TPR) repeat protein